MNDSVDIPEEQPRRSADASPQRRARVLALQVLYEVDLTGHKWPASLRAHAASIRAPQRIESMAEDYVQGVLGTLAELDGLIAKFAPMWPVSQLTVVDRNLLRLGLFEIRPDSATPPKVAINETVELAKQFGGDHSPRFINGVLGAALEASRSGEAREH
jgi:transcription antitermination protein NusB